MNRHFGTRPSHREDLMRRSRSHKLNLRVPLHSLITAAALLLLGPTCLAPPGWAQERARKSSRQSFTSPELAIDALVSSIRTGATGGVLKVLGPEAQRIVSSGDPTADQAARERFLAAYDEGHQMTQEGDNRAVLIIGKDDFPFPIPLVREGSAWHFDAQAGEEEILNRRIGKNELHAIEVMRAYVDAQREYAEVDRDGHGVQYARKLVSSDGKKDGLSWPAAEGEPESPFGPLVAQARAEGYAARSGRPEPYHGYLFKILTAQGKDAAGGAMDYVVAGRMIGGFGLVAAPAEYGNSGVMTLIVNHDGIVFQKDLGPETSRIAAEMTVFNPDSGWIKVAGP